MYIFIAYVCLSSLTKNQYLVGEDVVMEVHSSDVIHMAYTSDDLAQRHAEGSGGSKPRSTPNALKLACY
jgi:hypothetical protein